MKYWYRNVPGLGKAKHASVSHHAIEKARADSISDFEFEKTLFEPTMPDVSQGFDVVFRERNGVRLVIALKTGKGKCVVIKTAYRVEAPAVAKPGAK